MGGARFVLFGLSKEEVDRKIADKLVEAECLGLWLEELEFVPGTKEEPVKAFVYLHT